MSAAISLLHLEHPPATVRPVTSAIPLWQVVCEECRLGSRPRRLISEALGEWLDHVTGVPL